MRVRYAAICAALAATILTPASSSAMIIGMQDDQVTVCKLRNRDLAFTQFTQMHGNNVRINLMHKTEAGAGLTACSQPVELSVYDEAVAAVRSAGLTPQLTLTWYGQDNPLLIAEWAGQMAAHFKDSVDLYSVLNEPDITIPAADDCDPETVNQLVTTGTLRTVMVNKKVKVFVMVRRKIRRNGKVWMARRFKIIRKRVTITFNGRQYRIWKRTRKYRLINRPIAVSATGSSTVESSSISIRQGCMKVMRGRKYRAIFNAVEPAIRKTDPSSQVLAGETSPNLGLDLFVKQVPPVNADGWAHHCYQWDTTPDKSAGGFGIGDTAKVADLVKPLPLFYTECAYPKPQSAWNLQRFGGMFTDANRSGIAARAYQVAKEHEAKEMTWFGWFNPAPGWPGEWNTALQSEDDGVLSPEYLALRDLIGSW